MGRGQDRTAPRELLPQVESWNPLTDTVPIHSWVHPWLPLMQARLEPLYSPIRSKLSSALQKWHPSDSSAKLILQPWKDVFTPGSWEAFMVKNIVPKLGKHVGKVREAQWPTALVSGRRQRALCLVRPAPGAPCQSSAHGTARGPEVGCECAECSSVTADIPLCVPPAS